MKFFFSVICVKFKLGYSSRKAFLCITFSTVYSLQLLNVMVARNLSWFSGPSQTHFRIRGCSYLRQSGYSSSTSVLNFSKVHDRWSCWIRRLSLGISLKDLEKKKKNFFHFPSLDIKKIEHRQNLDNPRGKKINILPRVPRDVKFRRIRLVHHYL